MKSEVCEALLAVVEDLAVVLLVGPRHVVVVIEEGAVCLLQLGEDGELLEVSRRLGRDVDGSERRVELPKRRPHECPGADPRGSPAQCERALRQARLPVKLGGLGLTSMAAIRRARLGADDAVEGRGDEPVVFLRRLDGHGRRHGAQEVDEGGVGAVAREAVLRLLRDVEAGRVAQLDDAVERLEGDAHPLDQLRRAPADVAEKAPSTLIPSSVPPPARSTLGRCPSWTPACFLVSATPTLLARRHPRLDPRWTRRCPSTCSST